LNTTSRYKSADTIINKLVTRNKLVTANLCDQSVKHNLTKKLNTQVDINTHNTVIYADCDNVEIGLSRSQGDRTAVGDQIPTCPPPSNIGAFSQSRGVPTTFQPLLGVPLPRSQAGWDEMNAFFHSDSLFRFASGKIGDLDLAVDEFNRSIYNYLEGKFGTLRETDSADKIGDR